MSARSRTRSEDLVALLERATVLARARPLPEPVAAPAATLLRDVIEELARRHGRLVHLTDDEVRAVMVRARGVAEHCSAWSASHRAGLVASQLERLSDGSYRSNATMRAALRSLNHPGGRDEPAQALRSHIASLDDSELVRCTLGCGEVGPRSLAACPWCGHEGVDP